MMESGEMSGYSPLVGYLPCSSCGLLCSVEAILQPAPYLPEPVLLAKVILPSGSRKVLDLQGTVSFLYSTQQSPLKFI